MPKLWKNTDGSYEDKDIIYQPTSKVVEHKMGTGVIYAKFFKGFFKESGNELPFDFYMLTGRPWMYVKGE